MKRREFLSTTLAAAALSLAPRTSRAADGLVEVLIDEPIGTIAPEIHSHFVEHLGGVVYDGIWVGENSKIPNLGGIRKELVDHFNRHAEKLAMCNVAQLVNCIHAPFIALEDRFAATTIFHVFDMYKAHQGGQSLRFVSDAPSISFGAS